MTILNSFRELDYGTYNLIPGTFYSDGHLALALRARASLPRGRESVQYVGWDVGRILVRHTFY